METNTNLGTSKSAKQNDNKVKVVVRVRPLIEEELLSKSEARIVTVKTNQDEMHVVLSKTGISDREFVFDYVASYKRTTQESFYQSVGEPLVSDLFSGYNSTIVAYGQVLSKNSINF